MRRENTPFGKQSEPLVTIGMPVFNCERTIARSICSIVRQSYRNWELLVIDDGSQDRTVEVAQRFGDPRIRLVVDGDRRRIAGRLNQAVALARGEYFARMDGDDISFPDRLRTQVNYLIQHPDVDLLGGQIIVFKRDGRLLGIRGKCLTHEDICGKSSRGFQLCHPTWIAKTDWFRKNPYPTDAKLCEDRVLLLRTHRSSRFAAVPEIVLGYREDDVYLQKIWPARVTYSKALFNEAKSQREHLRAIFLAAAEISKFALDVIAIATGLKYQILRHRAKPVSEEVQQAWAGVWASTNGC